MLTHDRKDVIAVDADQGSRRRIAVTDRVDEDRRVEVLKQGQEGEPEGPSIDNREALGDFEIAD